MDGHTPKTATGATGLLDATITNITYLIEGLVEDKTAPWVHKSRQVCNSGVDGERVSCLYRELFSGKIDLQKLGQYRRKREFRVWCDANNIKFTGKDEYLTIEVPTVKFLRNTGLEEAL